LGSRGSAKLLGVPSARSPSPLFIVILTGISIGWIAPRSAQQAWAVGLMWVVLTLAFEFLAGHYLFHNPWSRLLEDYNVIRGRIWILVLITTLVSPRVCAGLRNLSLAR
jgi:hypothetical protein